MNGVVEAANKNIKKIIQKMIVIYKDWHEKLSFALHTYRTAVRTSTGTTLYSLVYGMEAVMPLEVEIDTTKRLMSSPKCRSVEVINNPARLGSNHREVNCINYKQQ